MATYPGSDLVLTPGPPGGKQPPQENGGKGPKGDKPPEQPPMDASEEAIKRIQDAIGVRDLPNGLDPIIMGNIDKEIAKEYKDFVAKHGKGSGHGGVARRVDELLNPPKIPWNDKLIAYIENALKGVGSGGTSYRRFGRGTYAAVDPATGKAKYVTPASFVRGANIAFVVDTSGSVGSNSLAIAIAEIGGALSNPNVERVDVISVDAEVGKVERVFSKYDVANMLVGGGGTDMRKGLLVALKLKPKPPLVVVFTDGGTDWPSTPPDAQVIIALFPMGGDKTVARGMVESTEQAVGSWADLIIAEDT